MKNNKKMLSLLTALTMTASAFSGMAVSAEESTGTGVTFIPTQTCQAVATIATYDEAGRLVSVSLKNDIEATEGEELKVEAPAGTRVMLWSSIEDMKPIANAKIAEVPAETATPEPEETATPEPEETATPEPTETATPEPEETATPEPEETATPEPEETATPEPTEGTVYFTEDFDSYVSTGVSTQGSESQSATMGYFDIYVGARGSGGDATTTATLENGTLKMVSGKYATSERGASIAINSEAVSIPTFAEVEDGNVITYSFDAKFTDSSSTLQLFGITSNAVGSGGAVVNDPYLSIANNSYIPTGEWVNVSIAVKNDKTAYLVIKNESGSIIYTTSFTAVGDTLEKIACYGGTTTVYIDNFKVSQSANTYGAVSASVKNSSGEAVEDAKITVESYTVNTAADGTATIVLPNGNYKVTASKNGYEHTLGLGDDDSANVTVNTNTVDANFELTLSTYVKVPDTVTIANGQTFISAPKTDTPSKSEAFTATVLDQYGIEMTSDEYGLTWEIYPTGTTNADPNVTIDENGVVAVAQGFSTENNVAVYDVVVTAATDDRNNKVKATIYVANNDIIYYEPINWAQTGGTGNRNGEINLAEALTLPEMSSVGIDVNFSNGTDGQRTIALVSDAGNLVGIQLQSGGTIKAWTGWTGNKDLNQYSDLDAFSESAVLVENYVNGTELNITFVIDTANKSVTVSDGTTSVSLPYTIEATTFTGFKAGHYRSYGAFDIGAVTVQEPDTNYLAITGNTNFAKVSGQNIEMQYDLSQSVIVQGETFTWTVTDPEGATTDAVTINDGVISVSDAAVAGEYTINAVSDINPDKNASLVIKVADFQKIEQSNTEIEGPRAYELGTDTGAKYAITKAIDAFGDDVAELLPSAVWTSDDTSVVTIAEDGTLTVVGAGTTNVRATITNGTAVSEFVIPVTVGTYSITGAATGAVTTVDASALISSDKIVGYQVTTSNNGVMVSQETVTEIPTSVNTEGADMFEIAPIFEFTDILNTPGMLGAIGTGYVIEVPSDTYNFTITATGSRCDIYANDQILVNNILQGGSTNNTVDVNDIVIDNGYVEISTTDYASGYSMSGSYITDLKLVKSPSIVNRTRKMYVIGDSLVCVYYNGGSATSNVQTGWGQVLQNYLTDDVEVVDLANSGATANGLMGSAFTQVLGSAKEGDIVVIESGYNDKTYDTTEIMTNALTTMINKSEELGATVVLVSPNASAHDYKGSVAWTGTMETVAETTDTAYVDLSQESYGFLYNLFGDDKTTILATYNVSDTLHSTYNFANVCASIVAKNLVSLGYENVVNTEYSYDFVDAAGNNIKCQAK